MLNTQHYCTEIDRTGSRGQAAGRRASTGQMSTAPKEKFLKLQRQGYVRYENLPIETKRGETHYVEFISNRYLVGKSKVIQCNIRDISGRIKIEQLNR